MRRWLPPALRSRNYRLYWSGLLVSVSGFQVFQFLQFLLVHEITGSVVALGVLGVANGVPAIVLGVFGGVVADKWDKRKLIIVTQSVSGGAILVLGLLTLFEVVAIWHILVLGVLVSGAGAFDSPARSAYYPRLVDRSIMISAVALNSTVWQSTRIVGPALAGVLVAHAASTTLMGIAVGLFASTAGFAVMVAVMVTLRVPGPAGVRGHAARNLLDGLVYVRSHSIVLFIILMSFVYSFFGWSYVVLLPVFAADVLEVGADLQGTMLASAGAGATVVTLALAFTSGRLVRRRGRMVIGGGASFGLALAGFAWTSEYIGSYPLAVVFMGVLGFTQTLYTTAAMGALQLAVPDHMRGRVFGIYAMMWGIMPLSGTQAAFLAEFVGVPTAVAIGGLIITAMALGPALRNPTLRSLSFDPPAEGVTGGTRTRD